MARGGVAAQTVHRHTCLLHRYDLCGRCLPHWSQRAPWTCVTRWVAKVCRPLPQSTTRPDAGGEDEVEVGTTATSGALSSWAEPSLTVPASIWVWRAQGLQSWPALR